MVRAVLELNAQDWFYEEGQPHAKLDGWCDWKRKFIHVYRPATKKDRAETIIHEIIHAVAPRLGEELVLQLGGDITDALCQLGVTFKKEWLSGEVERSNPAQKVGRKTKPHHPKNAKGSRKTARRRSRS